MCLLLEQLCLPAIKAKISLPQCPVNVTEDKILFTYYMESKMRFIEVERGEETGELLLENGFIDSYEGAGHYFKMYQKSIITVVGKAGQPIQFVKHTELEWNKIKFFESDIIHIAARHQFELSGRLMGLIPYKAKAKCRALYDVTFKSSIIMKNRNLAHKDDWATPKTLYNELDKEFSFDFDPCPYCHDLKLWSGLKIDWRERNFINPPYSRELKEAFVKKAIDESKKGKLCDVKRKEFEKHLIFLIGDYFGDIENWTNIKVEMSFSTARQAFLNVTNQNNIQWQKMELPEIKG